MVLGMVARPRPYIAQMSSNSGALECVDFAWVSAFIEEQGRISMKTRLCFLLLISSCFAGVSFAQDARMDLPKKDSSRLVSSKPQSDFSAAHFADGAEARLIFNIKPDFFMPDSSGTSCAYLRTYRVKRQARGSDAVAPAGYTTCVPTQRFEMRSAVQTITDTGGDEK